MRIKYFIPIDSNNLGLYFSSAIIAPHKYIKEPIDDTQSIHNEGIILTNKKFSNKSDCCLEVVLTEQEQEKLISNNKSCYLLYSALPVSRISSVYFYSKEKMENTIDLARSSSFIPELLIKVINKNNDDFFDEQICVFNNKEKADDLKYKINYFDRIIGGFSFMKIGGENHMNYSKNYFSTLAFFNDSIKEEVDKANKTFKLDFDYKFQGLFNDNDNEWGIWRKLIFGSHNEIVIEIGNKVQTKNGVYQQNEISDNKKYYILSILANYGPDQIKSKKTESLLHSLIANVIKHKEAIALFFGLNTGYEKFKKSYFIDNNNLPIKFELASRLDYYTIESIFQFIFNDTKIPDLSFLTEIIQENSKTKIDSKKYLTYRILDEDVIYDKKPTTIKEIFTEFMQKNNLVNVLSSVVEIIAKKNDIIKLSDDQKKHLQLKYFSIIENSFKVYLSKLEQKISKLCNEKETDLQQQLNKLKQEHNQITALLIKSDKTLFDEIDTDRDGKLSQQEIGTFMDEIIAAKNQLETKVNEFTEKFETQKYNTTNNIISTTVEEQTTQYNNNVTIIEIHKFYLNKLSVMELGKIAKTKNIVSTQKQVTQKNRNEIIEKIIKSDNKLL